MLQTISNGWLVYYSLELGAYLVKKGFHVLAT